MNYLTVVKNILKDPNLLKPHITYKDITKIDYKYLQQQGIKYLIIDKDNTISLPLDPNYYNENIASSIQQLSTHTMFNQVAILSNSIGQQGKGQYVFHHLPVIQHIEYKPFNYATVIQYLQQNNIGNQKVNSQQVAFVGDRLFTDVYMANANGSLAVYVQPLSTLHEHFGVRVIRAIENYILNKYL